MPSARHPHAVLLTGMETDLSLVQAERAAFSVGHRNCRPVRLRLRARRVPARGVLPRPDLRLITSLFLGTALSISSVKIVAMVVREMRFMRRNLGQVIVAGHHRRHDRLDHHRDHLRSGAPRRRGSRRHWPKACSARRCFSVLACASRRRVHSDPLDQRHLRERHACHHDHPGVMGLMALITHLIGVHTVLGAFVAGILTGQSPILTGTSTSSLRGLITALFMPVFFGLAGLGADLTILKDPNLLLVTLGLVLIASLGKFGGAFLGGWLGGLTRPVMALGCAMNARGSTEVIVATIGLSMGALSQNLYDDRRHGGRDRW